MDKDSLSLAQGMLETIQQQMQDIDRRIAELLAEMERTPPENRRGPEWGGAPEAMPSG